MKETLKKPPILENWFYTQSPLVITRPALRETAACLGFLLSGFLLSCGKLAGEPAPFVLGLLTAAGGGLRGLCALIGAVGGALTMQSFSQGLELTSAALLTFVTMYIFGSLWVTRQSWFRCLVPGVMRAVVGGIFLFSQPLTPLLLGDYVKNVLLSALSPLAFTQLSNRRSLATMAAMGFFLVGLWRRTAAMGAGRRRNGGLRLTILSARRTDTGTAAAVGACAGLAVDLSRMTLGSWTLSLTAAALAGTALPRRRRLLRTLCSGAVLGIMLALRGVTDMKDLLSPAVGVAFSPCCCPVR